MGTKFTNELERKIVDMFNTGMSASMVGRQLGFQTTSITRVLKRNGCKLSDGKGENHSGWKGGRGLKSGYWAVYNPTHPRALNIGRVYEHIIILEQKLGRYISKGEPIHHIDLDRLNNDINNLYLCENHKEHQSLHNSLDDVTSQLFKQGIIGFKNGKYYIV